MEKIVGYIDHFEEHSLKHSEEKAIAMRKTMYNKIKGMKLFNEKSQFIDQEIEYDQRFFNDGYP